MSLKAAWVWSVMWRRSFTPPSRGMIPTSMGRPVSYTQWVLPAFIRSIEVVVGIRVKRMWSRVTAKSCWKLT